MIGYSLPAVSSLGKRLLSVGRRLCLPDLESADIRMGEYRRRAVGGDPPVPTRVLSRFPPRREPALQSPLTELLPGQEAWIWSSTDSISSSRTRALTIGRLSLMHLYSWPHESWGFQTDRARPPSSVFARSPAKWLPALGREAPYVSGSDDDSIDCARKRRPLQI